MAEPGDRKVIVDPRRKHGLGTLRDKERGRSNGDGDNHQDTDYCIPKGKRARTEEEKNEVLIREFENLYKKGGGRKQLSLEEILGTANLNRQKEGVLKGNRLKQKEKAHGGRKRTACVLRRGFNIFRED